MSILRVVLLGSPQVTVDGQPVSVDTRKAIALLAYLAVTGQVLQRDRLAALLWPDAGHDRARAALRRTLSTLNSALGGEWLVVTRDTIALRQSPDLDLDVARFRAAVAAAREDPARALPSLETAAALYRGAFMDGFHLRDSPEFDDWRYLEGESLRRDLAWALDHLSSAYCERGDVDAAISAAHRWLALDPLHEEAHRRLMQLYARSGQIAAAVRQYRECVRILEQELGVEPLEATTALYQAIQEQRRPVDPPGDAVQQAPARESSGPARTGPVAPTALTYSLVGREKELLLFESALDAAEPDGHLVVVEGEAGVGKTRLLETFVDRAAARGIATLALRCYEGEATLTFGPFIDALKPALLRVNGPRHADSLPEPILSEVGRLFPELLSSRPGVPPPAPLDSPGAQFRFYDAMLDALRHVVGGEGRGVLLVDDVQWADGASLDLLAYLVHRLARCPVLVLAWRDDQVPADHRLRAMLASAMRAGNATLISPGRLQAQDVEALAREVLSDAGQAGRLGVRLLRETEGLPFFLVQYLDVFRQQPDSLEGDSWPLPGGIRDLLNARVAGLSSEELQVLTALSAIGSASSFDILLEVSGRSEDEVLAALEGLLARGLVIERASDPVPAPEPLYDVSHDKLREFVYSGASLVRRRLLHRRIANALERQAARQARRAEFARIAYHFQLAGEEASAARAYREAGDAAAELYANREAIGHYEAALALGYDDAATLHERIGDLHTRLGNFDLALAAYEKVAALLPPEDSGKIEHKLGNLYHRLGEWGLASRHYAAAGERFAARGDAAAAGDRARLYADWSLTAHRQGDRERARSLGEQSLELARTAGDDHAVARSHNLLGILARSAGDPAARGHFEESLRLAREIDDAETQVAALNNLALIEHAALNHEQAIALGREALALAALQGDRHREAALRSNLADYLHAAGRMDEAMEQLRESAAIYAEIGIVAGERQAEIWKLTEW